jgi:hypothetical protein
VNCTHDHLPTNLAIAWAVLVPALGWHRVIVGDANLMAATSAPVDSGVVRLLARFVGCIEILVIVQRQETHVLVPGHASLLLSPEAPGTLDLAFNEPSFRYNGFRAPNPTSDKLFTRPRRAFWQIVAAAEAVRAPRAGASLTDQRIYASL